MTKYRKIQVAIDHGGVCNYYSNLPVRIGDKVCAESVNGILVGRVTDYDPEIDYNPFKTGKAHKRVLRIMKEEEETTNMLGFKTVEVKHINSARKGIFYTHLDLKVGDTVVYDGNMPNVTATDKVAKKDNESPYSAFHVGVVTDINPIAAYAECWVVDTVDTAAYNFQLGRAKSASKLLAKLNAKAKQFKDLELLSLIATHDPETRELLAEYLELTK